MGRKAEFVSRMETQMKNWDRDVDALVVRGEKASAESRASYDVHIKDLRATRDAAQKTFEEIRFAGESAGAQMQAGMESAWKTMEKAYQKATADLRK